MFRRLLLSAVIVFSLVLGGFTSGLGAPHAVTPVHADFDQSFYGDSGDSGLFWQWAATVAAGGVAIVIGATINSPGWSPPELDFGGGGSW